MLRYTTSLLIGFVLSALVATSAAEAQGVRPLAAEEVAGLDEYSATSYGKISPSGRYFVYALRGRKNVELEQVGKEHPEQSFVVDTRSGEFQSLSESRGSSSGAAWSPDGQTLAFFSDRDGSLGLWAWDTTSKRAHRVGSEHVARGYPWETPVWLPDSKRLLARLPRESELSSAMDVGTQRVSTKSTSDGGTAHVVVYNVRNSGTGKPLVANDDSADLALFDLSSGRVSRVARDVRPGALKVAPDGSAVAISSRDPLPVENRYLWRWTLEVVSLEDFSRRRIAADILQEQPMGTWFSWSPNSQEIAYTDIGSQTYKSERKTVGQLYAVHLSDGATKSTKYLAHPSFGDDRRAPYWSPQGNDVYVIGGGAIWQFSYDSGKLLESVRIPGAEIFDIVRYSAAEGYASADGGKSMLVLARDSHSLNEGIWRVDLRQGHAVVLQQSAESFGSYPGETTTATADASTISYRVESADRYPNYWIADEQFQTKKQLTHVNSQFDKVALGRSKLIEWRSSRGIRLKGVLLLPSNYESGRRYPLVVDVYGGFDPSQSLNRFAIDVDMNPRGMGQFLATHGYAVFRPESRLRTGTPMKDVAACVLSGVDKVERLGVADPAHLGVIGHSYGGYSVLSLIVQTTRFKAAIVYEGQGNLINFAYRLNASGATWTGVAEDAQGRLGKSLWEDRSRYIRNSPMFFLDKVQTPLLIVHGSRDENTPIYQADQIFAGLKRLGREAEYVKYLDEGHNFDNYIDNVDFLRRVDAWFAAHI